MVWLKSNINKCVVETTNDVSFIRIWYADFPMPGLFSHSWSFGWALFFISFSAFLPPSRSNHLHGACKKLCAAAKRHINWDFLFHLLSLWKWFCMRLYYVLHVDVEREKKTPIMSAYRFRIFFPTCVHAFSWLTSSGLFQIEINNNHKTNIIWNTYWMLCS